jgi:molybdate transport system substrate-binding protein
MSDTCRHRGFRATCALGNQIIWRLLHTRIEGAYMKRLFIIAAAAALMVPAVTSAAGIKVLSTQATEEAYRELVPRFEKATGHKVTTVFTGTLGAQKRLADGESYDMIIMAGPAIDAQIKAGKAVAGSRVDIAKSGVAVGVPKGAPKPDISTTEALKKTLLAAKSIGYSTGPSGIYMISLFERLGLTDQVKDKLKQTPTGVFVGTLIAGREVELGFQQVSELGNFPGVDYVGPLPADVQQTTVFSSGMIVGAKEAEAAKTLVKFLTTPEAGSAFKKRGMEPG